MPSDGIVDLGPVVEKLMKRYDEEKKANAELDALWLALGIRARDCTTMNGKAV